MVNMKSKNAKGRGKPTPQNNGNGSRNLNSKVEVLHCATPCAPCRNPSCLRSVKKAKSCCSVVFKEKKTMQPSNCDLCNIINKAKTIKKLKNCGQKENVGVTAKLSSKNSDESDEKSKMRKKLEDYCRDEPVRECRKDKCRCNFDAKRDKGTSNKEPTTKGRSRSKQIAKNKSAISCKCGPSCVASRDTSSRGASVSSSSEDDSSKKSRAAKKTSQKGKASKQGSNKNKDSRNTVPNRGRSRESCTCRKRQRDKSRRDGSKSDRSSSRKRDKSDRSSSRRDKSKSDRSSSIKRDRSRDVHPAVRSRSSSYHRKCLKPSLTDASMKSKKKSKSKSKLSQSAKAKKEREKKALLEQIFSRPMHEYARPHMTKFSNDKIINERLIVTPALVKERRRSGFKEKEKKLKTPKSKVESYTNPRLNMKKIKSKHKTSTVYTRNQYDILFPNPFDNLVSTKSIFKPRYSVVDVHSVKRKQRHTFENDPLYASRKSTPKNYIRHLQPNTTIIDCNCPAPYKTFKFDNNKERSKMGVQVVIKEKEKPKCAGCMCKKCDCKVCCVKEYKAHLKTLDFECQCSSLVNAIDTSKSLPTLSDKITEHVDMAGDIIVKENDKKHICAALRRSKHEEEVKIINDKKTRKIDNQTVTSTHLSRRKDRSLKSNKELKKLDNITKSVDRNIVCICETSSPPKCLSPSRQTQWMVDKCLTCCVSKQPIDDKVIEIIRQDEKTFKDENTSDSRLRTKDRVTLAEEVTQTRGVKQTEEIVQTTVVEVDEDVVQTLERTAPNKDDELDSKTKDNPEVANVAVGRSINTAHPKQKGSDQPQKAYRTKFSNMELQPFKKGEYELICVEYENFDPTSVSTNSDTWRGNYTFQHKFEAMLKNFLERVRGLGGATNKAVGETSGKIQEIDDSAMMPKGEMIEINDSISAENIENPMVDSETVAESLISDRIGPEDVKVERLEPKMNILEDLDREIKWKKSATQGEFNRMVTTFSDFDIKSDNNVVSPAQESEGENSPVKKCDVDDIDIEALLGHFIIKPEDMQQNIAVENSAEKSVPDQQTQTHKIQLEMQANKSESKTIEADNKVNNAESKIVEAEKKDIKAESRVIETENKVIKAESKIIKAEDKVITAESKVTEAENKVSKTATDKKSSDFKITSAAVADASSLQTVEIKTSKSLEEKSSEKEAFKKRSEPNIKKSKDSGTITETKTTTAASGVSLKDSHKDITKDEQPPSKIRKIPIKISSKLLKKKTALDDVVEILADQSGFDSKTDQRPKGHLTPSWVSKDFSALEADNSNIEPSTKDGRASGVVTPLEGDEYLIDIVSLGSDNKLFEAKEKRSRSSDISGVIRDAIDLRNQSEKQSLIRKEAERKAAEESNTEAKNELTTSTMLRTLEEAVEKRIELDRIRDPEDPNVQATETQGSIIDEIGRMNSRDERFMEGTSARNDTISIQFPERPETVNQGVATTDPGCGCPQNMRSQGT